VWSPTGPPTEFLDSHDRAPQSPSGPPSLTRCRTWIWRSDNSLSLRIHAALQNLLIRRHGRTARLGTMRVLWSCRCRRREARLSSSLSSELSSAHDAKQPGLWLLALTAALRRRTAERVEMKAVLSGPSDLAPCLPYRSARWSRSWAGCQRCLVREPGRSAPRCTRAWVCILNTIPLCDESRRLPPT
jgi:hypothetical protein